MLKKATKTFQIDSADRDTAKYPTNGDYTIYLPRVYKNVSSLRLKGADINVNTPFSLSGIGGLSLWLDSADTSTLYSDSAGTIPITIGGNVGLWKDKSPNNYNVVQTTAGNRPVWTDSNSGIEFNPTNINGTVDTTQYLINNATRLSTKEHSIFIVQKQRNLTDLCRFFSLTQSGRASDFILTGISFGSASLPYTTCRIYGLNGGTYNPRFIDQPASPPPSPWPKGIYSDVLVFTEPNSSTGTLYLTGSNSVPTPTKTVSGSFANANPMTLHIGCGVQSFARSGYFSGNIYEILVYSRAVTVTERQQIEGYLAWKWGIQSNLPVNHPYYTSSQVVLVKQHAYTSGMSLLNDTAISNNTYYFLMEIEGLNKSDETCVGGNKSSFIDKYFAKIPNTKTTNAIVSYNDKNLNENIAQYNPPIKSLDRLKIKLRTHSQQDSSGFVYFMNDYNLTFEVEYLENSMEIYEK